MSDKSPFDPQTFLPYRLNMAAEAASVGFQKVYRSRYGMQRAQWRVLFHLGAYGAMTATEIRRRSGIDKAKISRAVAALDGRGWLSMKTPKTDRRQSILSLTAKGQTAYADLCAVAEAYDGRLASLFTPEEAAVLRKALLTLSMADIPDA
ncbi:MAG: MarR family winged helix-turn-helix transcriptional regulator [Pseudomonadota bacterium]